MSNSPQIIQASSMPQQQLPSYPAGANSPMTAGIIKQQQQAEMQNARNKIGGAPPVVQVPPVPSGSVSPNSTASNYKDLTQLAQQQSTQAAYDNARTNSDTNAIASQQKAIYSGKGGKRRRRRTKKRSHRKSKRRQHSRSRRRRRY
jgi:hypothetical protein